MRTNLDSRINWGRGRLRKHESIYSFFAKFCYINGLTPRQARNFFANKLSATNAILRHYQRPNTPFDFSTLLASLDQIKIFAALLDEPFSVVKTLCGEHKDLSFIPSMGASLVLNEEAGLRYCDECVKEGYHAYFHEFRYLALCPIHRRPLFPVTPCEKRYSRFERNVLALQSLYESSSANWPVPPNSFPLDKLQRQHTALLPFFHWRKKLHDTMSIYERATIWSSFVNAPSNVRISFGETEHTNSLAWALNQTGIPVPVRLLLKCEPLTEQFCHTFPSATDHNLQKILGELKIDVLLNVYRHWWAWAKRAEINGEALTEMITKLRSDHASCRCCRYRLSGSGQYLYICPYLHVADLLEQNWGELTESSVSSIAYKYLTFVDTLESLSIDSVLAYEKKRLPQRSFGHHFENLHVTWRLPDNVSDLLQAIVAAELQMQFEMLLEWALLISNDTHSDESTCLPRCVTLTRTDLGLKLMRWKGATTAQASNFRIF
jgi:hypothetical protein